MGILSGCARRFAAARRGNVAVIFALALVPLMAAVGAGLDFARATVVRAEMNNALDAAALAVGSASGLTTAQMQTLAQQYFNANYTVDSSFGTPVAVSVSKNSQSVTISTSCDVPTSVLKVAGFQSMPVAASTTVVWGQQKLWVAMVLDNTGSMSQGDSGGSKMSALKTASHQLLTLLQNASSTVGDVRVAVIPFARNVNIGTGYADESWLSFSDFTAAPPKPSTNVGPGDSCPWSDNDEGYHCTSGSSNGSWNAYTIPSWGSTAGYICPSVTTSGHYWNGCYNSVQKSGGGYKHTWIPNDTDTWSGCVTDRGMATKPNGQDYDVKNTTPSTGTTKTLMVAENSPGCPDATILPLGYDWTAANNKIDAMQPDGSTNQTIGLVWGWQALTQGDPLDPPALPANTQRIIVLLSDGLNTQNRWSGNGLNQSTDVDGRMALACANAKADGVTIYAVYVDIGGTQGNSSVLQACASDSSKYFDLTSSSQIVAAFQAIGQQITNLRVSK